MPKCMLVKILHWILNKGRLDLDHGAVGGASPRGTKKSSKLELRDKVGGLEGGASLRTSRGPALPCCRVGGTRRGRRTKPCVNMNG